MEPGKTEADPHAACREEIAALKAIVAEQQRRIQDLEARVHQNSRNSSRPPSSDPPSVPPRSPKPPTGRESGGQPGHEGHQRERLGPDKLTRVVDVKPKQCGGCGRELKGEDPDPQKHQVTELPPLAAETTEWRLHALGCECGRTTRAELPPEVPPGAFGPRLQAAVGYLTGLAHLTKRPIEEVMRDLFGVSISVGSVVRVQQTVSEAVAPAVEEARTYVQEQAVANVDETGWREGLRGEGQPGRKKAWLWVAVTQWVTIFMIHARRGAQAAQVLLGPFAGYLVTDRWGAYNGWPLKKRQVCWAHLIRDFVKLGERGESAGKIAEALLVETEKMFELWHRVRDGTLGRSTFQDLMKPIRQGVEALLAEGTRCGLRQAERTCGKILKIAPALWTFVDVEGIEPTNNAAERAVRPAVLYRKACLGTQSEAGSRFVERMLTVVTTLRQQGRNVMEYLTEACALALVGQKPPSLLPSRVRTAAA